MALSAQGFLAPAPSMRSSRNAVSMMAQGGKESVLIIGGTRFSGAYLWKGTIFNSAVSMGKERRHLSEMA